MESSPNVGGAQRSEAVSASRPVCDHLVGGVSTTAWSQRVNSPSVSRSGVAGNKRAGSVVGWQLDRRGDYVDQSFRSEHGQGQGLTNRVAEHLSLQSLGAGDRLIIGM